MMLQAYSIEFCEHRRGSSAESLALKGREQLPWLSKGLHNLRIYTLGITGAAAAPKVRVAILTQGKVCVVKSSRSTFSEAVCLLTIDSPHLLLLYPK